MFKYVYNITVFMYSFLYYTFKNWTMQLNKELVLCFLEELKTFWQNPALFHAIFIQQIKTTYLESILFWPLPCQGLAQCRLNKGLSNWTQKYVDLSITPHRVSFLLYHGRNVSADKISGSQRIMHLEVAWDQISFLHEAFPVPSPSSLLTGTLPIFSCSPDHKRVNC